MDETIKEQIEAFEANLRPVTPEMIAISKGKALPEVAPVIPEAAPAGGGEEACFNKEFKTLIDALPERYIGKAIKDFLVEFIKTIPDCEVLNA